MPPARSRARATALVVAGLVAPWGCSPAGGDPPLVVATPWPESVRIDLARAYRDATDDSPPIEWVGLAPGDPIARVVERRGGVDVLLGGPTSAHDQPMIRRPVPGRAEPDRPVGDPRDDPSSLARARAILGASGWAAGYRTLIREAARSRIRPIDAGLAGDRTVGPEVGPGAASEVPGGGTRPGPAGSWIGSGRRAWSTFPTIAR